MPKHPDDTYVVGLRVGSLLGMWLRHRKRVTTGNTIPSLAAKQAETNRLLAEQNELLRQQAAREQNPY